MKLMIVLCWKHIYIFFFLLWQGIVQHEYLLKLFKLLNVLHSASLLVLLLPVCFSLISFRAGMQDEMFVLILKLSKKFIPCPPWQNNVELCAWFFCLLWFVLMIIGYIYNFFSRCQTMCLESIWGFLLYC